MNLVRIAWAIIALACMSYVGFGFVAAKRAEAATLEEVTALMTAFAEMKFRVITTRKIVFWDAQANQTAHCWVFTASVPTPPKGQGFYAHQWKMSTVSTTDTEDQCYAQY